MKRIHKYVKFQTVLNLFLVTIFMLGLITSAPNRVNANPTQQQDPIGESEIDQFDPTRPFLLERGLDRFSADGKYLQDGRPVDWAGPGGDLLLSEQMMADDPGPEGDNEALLMARPPEGLDDGRIERPLRSMMDPRRPHQDEPQFEEFPLQSNEDQLRDEPNPSIQVVPLINYIEGWDWTPNITVTLKIGSDEWTKESDDWGWVWFAISPFDILPGQILTVTDGTYTRTHTVTDLAITEINQDTNTISGTATPEAEISIYALDKNNYHWIYPTADGSGNWSANFTGYVDIAPGSWGEAFESDEQGNATLVSWYVPNPRIDVYPNNERVSGSDWTPNTTITLTIGSNEWMNLSDDYGWVSFSNLPIELLPGQVVAMTDGTYSRSHTVTNLIVTEVNQDLNIVSGTADAGNAIGVDACANSNCYWLDATADVTGRWSANFSGIVDITAGVYGWAREGDDEGNSTIIYWYIPDPYFQVYPLGDYIYGYLWLANTTVTASVGSSVIGSGVSNKAGRVFISSELHDLEPGQVVKLTDGTYTRLHTIRNLAVTNIEQAADIVSGTADANTALSYVSARDNLGQWFYLYPSANSFGNWHADFSGLVDIKIGTGGWAVQGDEAGNETCIRWFVPYPPNISVYPLSDYVSGNNWTQNATVTLTIGDNQWIADSDGWGWVYFNVSPFDIKPGQSVQMTDGIHTATHTVMNHVVTNVDPDSDTVCGTAEPGSEIEVGTWETYYYYVRSGIADASGDWCADFSGLFDITTNSRGYASQYDEGNNSTNIYWYVVDPKLTVYTDFDDVYGYQWPANTKITLIIDDARVSWTEISSSFGSVYFNLEDFDIVPNQIVEMRDETGTYTITHTVRNITVTDVDTNADTVSGTADPASALVACAIDYVNQTYTRVCLDIDADKSGNWHADFSASINIAGGSYGYVYQFDEHKNETVVYWFIELDYHIFLPLIVR